MIRLPALTVWQPWASLIIALAKPWEFRGRAAPRAYAGRRIAIHAGARKPAMAEMRALRAQLARGEQTGLQRETAHSLLERWIADPVLLPLSSVLGTAVMLPSLKACDIPVLAPSFANDSERREHSNWAWPMTDVRPLEPPVPMRGAQGFWTCELEET